MDVVNFVGSAFPTSLKITVMPFSDESGAQALISMLSHAGPSARNEKYARALSQKLGGHPLAIAQMAGLMRCRSISLEEFLLIYDRQKENLHMRAPPTTSHESTISTIWLMSFMSLSDISQKVLGVLSLLDPDCIPEDFLYAMLIEDVLDIFRYEFLRQMPVYI